MGLYPFIPSKGNEMQQIVFTSDPEDTTGRRCEDIEGGLKCHRRKGHSSNTKTIKKNDDDTETVVEFNHRGMINGRFFTW